MLFCYQILTNGTEKKTWLREKASKGKSRAAGGAFSLARLLPVYLSAYPLVCLIERKQRLQSV